MFHTHSHWCQPPNLEKISDCPFLVAGTNGRRMAAVAPVKNFIAGANSDAVTIQADGSGFPVMNGQPFFDVGLTFRFSGIRDFVDTGSGQTFAQVVGVSPLDFATASSTFAEIRNTNFASPALTMTVAPVPEPSTWVMGAAGLACAGWGAFHRRKRA